MRAPPRLGGDAVTVGRTVPRAIEEVEVSTYNSVTSRPGLAIKNKDGQILRQATVGGYEHPSDGYQYLHFHAALLEGAGATGPTGAGLMLNREQALMVAEYILDWAMGEGVDS